MEIEIKLEKLEKTIIMEPKNLPERTSESSCGTSSESSFEDARSSANYTTKPLWKTLSKTYSISIIFCDSSFLEKFDYLLFIIYFIYFG